MKVLTKSPWVGTLWGQKPTVPLFAWQTNKAILFYFTQNCFWNSVWHWWTETEILASALLSSSPHPSVQFSSHLTNLGVSLVAQRIKCLHAMWETRVRSLGREVPLEKEMATHSNILAWRIPWTRSLVGYSPQGSQKFGHDWAISHWVLSCYKQNSDQREDVAEP